MAAAKGCDLVAVVDYGGSNLRSVARALAHVAPPGTRVEITGDPALVRRADRVVFPGQGAMGQCMAGLASRDLVAALTEAISERPFLGICLGLQCLFEVSDEDGGTRGLGVLTGGVARLPEGLRDPASGLPLKVPHMGWNRVMPAAEHPLWSGIAPGTRFYFVHSYVVRPEDPAVVAATTDYGAERFVSAVAFGRAFAVQFHPEKSQQPGLRLLANFLAL